MSNKLQGYDTTIIFGTVEDVQDPEQLNRVRVRLPLHGNKSDTPTDHLPWARVTSPGMGVGPNQGGGGGQGGLSIAKDAVIMALVNHDNHEDVTVLGVLPTNSTGKNITGASAGGQSSVALGGISGGPTGGKHEPATVASKTVLKDAPASFPQVKGKYPQTHINVSESGMRNILHDVAGETYQATVHPTGTFTEMQADGNYVTYTVKDRKEAVDGTYTLFSEKDMVIATNGNLQLKVKGSMLLEVEGDLFEYVAGNRAERVGGDLNVGAKGEAVIIGEQLAAIESAGTTYVTSGGTVQLNQVSRILQARNAAAQLPTADKIKSNISEGRYGQFL